MHFIDHHLTGYGDSFLQVYTKVTYSRISIQKQQSERIAAHYQERTLKEPKIKCVGDPVWLVDSLSSQFMPNRK